MHWKAVMRTKKLIKLAKQAVPPWCNNDMAARVSNQPIFYCIWVLPRRNQCPAHTLVGNLLLWFSWIDKLSNCLLNIYVYTHTLVLFSTLAREASFYSGPKLTPAEDKQLWSSTFCRDQGTWQKKGWKECKSWRRDAAKGVFRTWRASVILTNSQLGVTCPRARQATLQHGLGGDHEAPPLAKGLWSGEGYFISGGMAAYLYTHRQK